MHSKKRRGELKYACAIMKLVHGGATLNARIEMPRIIDRHRSYNASGNILDKKQLRGGILLTAASIVVSCVFVAYGAGVVFGEEVPGWIIVFGVVTSAYGLCSLAVLILAWLHYGIKAKKFIGYLAVWFMVVFFLGSLDAGMVSGLEVVGLLFVGVMLFVNWLAVSAVVRLRNFS